MVYSVKSEPLQVVVDFIRKHCFAIGKIQKAESFVFHFSYFVYLISCNMFA